jgi:hypothetical protein
MSLFKSKDEKRMERNMEINRGITSMKRQIQTLAKSELEWAEKTKRAMKMDSADQVAFMRKTLKATVVQRKMLERQLLTLEAAKQMKDQAESFAVFAGSMGAVSKSIAEVYTNTDLTKSQLDFERAMNQADTMAQRMDLFLSMSGDTMFGAETSMADNVISDAEIDKMLGVDPKLERKKTRDELDREIAAEMGDDHAKETGKEK